MIPNHEREDVGVVADRDDVGEQDEGRVVGALDEREDEGGDAHAEDDDRQDEQRRPAIRLDASPEGGLIERDSVLVDLRVVKVERVVLDFDIVRRRRGKVCAVGARGEGDTALPRLSNDQMEERAGERKEGEEGRDSKDEVVDAESLLDREDGGGLRSRGVRGLKLGELEEAKAEGRLLHLDGLARNGLCGRWCRGDS